ncbi:MAG: hypothetical protein ACKVS6_06695 [Planctomycetota bacterium]
MIKENAPIRSFRRRTIAIVLILHFAACRSTPPLPEFSQGHPANPNSEEAPVASRPGLLDKMDLNIHETQNSNPATKPAQGNMRDHMKK